MKHPEKDKKYKPYIPEWGYATDREERLYGWQGEQENRAEGLIPPGEAEHTPDYSRPDPKKKKDIDLEMDR